MTRARHILCLYPWLALGGADKFNQDMLAGLMARGWRATIVTTQPSTHPWRAAFEQLTDDIVDLTCYPPDLRPTQLLQILRSRPIDCVLISHSSVGYELLPYLRAHLPEITYVDYCHIVDSRRRDGGYPRMSLNRASALDLQIVSSHQLLRWMCERGGASDRIAVCTTNVASTDWDPARYDRQALRAELGIPPPAPVVCYGARLERQKQPLLAVAVIAQVAAQVPEAHFLIAGDGPFAGCVRGLLRWHGLGSRARLLGPVSNQRMRELLALSDIFFLPSEMEGISLAIYEAMSMGVVPVSAAVGGQAELVTPECGMLIQRGSGERAAYAQALVRLVRQPELARQMGLAARQRVTRHFRLEQMAARMDQLLEQARALHRMQPRPPIDVAAAAIIAARGAGTASHTTARAFRQRLRQLYWGLADHGAWWIVAACERMRHAIGLL